MYTKILTLEGIVAVKNAYGNYPKKSIATKVITTFPVMGTICTSTYANILIWSFESKYVYQYIYEKVIKFSQFIDDLLMIWTGKEEELLKFINELNQKHKTIKFDFKYSNTKNEFLDVLVYKKTSITNCKHRSIKNQLITKAIYMQTQITRDH